MRVINGMAPGARRLAGHGTELSRDAKKRLGWMDFYRSHGRNARLTCRHYGITPQTFYRWKRRYDPEHLESLEERSRRPRRRRQPTASPELVEAVLELREANPRWGKDKLAPLLREAGWQVSNSMVGRIMRRLREQGRLVGAPRTRIPVRRRSFVRPYAIRKPKGYPVSRPGDLVQVDTLDLRPLPGVILKHFTARDTVSRWDVLEVATRATAVTASRFLDRLQERAPFPVRAIQVDGGSEFEAEFERECEKRGILLFVLPPRSPKLNGRVERAHRTHREEFYEVADLDWTVAAIRPQLLAWEHIYNTVRPHQALGYKRPWEVVCENRQRRAG
jgi:transposase InsO family protein